MTDLTERQKRKLSRALERRFGASTLPNLFSVVVVDKRLYHRCRNALSGSYIEGFFGKNGKLNVTFERGNA